MPRPRKAQGDPNELMRKALKNEVDDLLESGKIDGYVAGNIREKIYDDKFKSIEINGLLCYDIVEVLINLMEHEITHLLLFIYILKRIYFIYYYYYSFYYFHYC